MANLIVLLARFPWWNWAPQCHSKLMSTWSISLGEIGLHDGTQNWCPLDPSLVWAVQTNSKIIPSQLQCNRESILTICSSRGIMAKLIVLLARFPWWNWAPRWHSKLMPTWSIPCLSIANNFQNNSKSVTVKQRVYFDRLQQQGDHGKPDRTTGPFPLVKLGSTMALKIDVHLIHPLFEHCKQIPK